MQWLTWAVTLLWNGQHIPLHRIDSSVIADLEVVAQQQNAFPGSEIIHPAHQRTQDSEVPDVSAPEPFIDPAILSFTKPPIDTRTISADSNPSQYPQPDTISPVMIADSIKQSPVSVVHHENSFVSTRTTLSSIAASVPAAKSPKRSERRDSTATATLTKPFDHMALKDEDPDLAGPSARGTSSLRGTARKNRRGVTRKAKDHVSESTKGLNDARHAESPQTSLKKAVGKSKGWRQTPLVEEATTLQAEPSTRRPKHQSRKSYLEDTNGWATEDATDIQDLGEFDFEHNLSKFDKRQVFDDIRRDDTTADDDRLFSFNRIVRPGTNGGRNLHHTENVLDLPDPKANTWKSEAGETEDELLEEHYSSGRASRRDGSRRPPPSRKSTLIPSKASAAASPLNGSASSFRASLRLASTNKPCTYISPLQMLEIEQLCTSELGLGDELLTENAGRGIAEAALTLPPHLPPNSTILFLVGNHKSGSRAVAAARHLRNRNIRVSICVLGGERENMLLESLRRQLDIYRKSGGWIVRWDEFQSKLSSGTSPHDLIVDALLGMHVTFSELRTDDQAIAFEMIRWANRSAVPILSVDIPSGMNASNGEVTLVDSSSLIVHATFIACLGAPKSGLVAALGTGEGRSHDWKLSVVDIGISNVAWKKYGTRRRHGVDFGREWVVNLKFVAGGGGGAAATTTTTGAGVVGLDGV